MTGLRKRVVAGFTSIVVVLVLAGMVSFVELSILSNETGNILDTNRQYNELAIEMNDAVAMHNNAFIQVTAFSNSAYINQCNEAARRLESCIEKIEAQTEERQKELEEIAATAKQLQNAVNAYTAYSAAQQQNDSTTTAVQPRSNRALEAYNRYQPIRNKIEEQIEAYVAQTQDKLAPGAVQLQNNAYRAVIPVFLSLMVMIAIVLMLFYFMLIYCVNPILAINESLKRYLEFKVPFAPKSQNRDELQEICESIESLIQSNAKLIKE
ncbi:MAG: hypothetical protein SNH79_03390 [Rikenellaceae bacterium]